MLFQLFIAVALSICVYIWFFRRKKETEFPAVLFKDLRWNFCGGQYKEDTDFVQVVKGFGTDHPNPDWQPDEIVLPAKHVIILFSGSVIDENDEAQQGDYEFLLTAEGYSFSAMELLYKMHTHLLPYLKGESTCFLSGLTFWGNDKGIPIYLLKMDGK